jgi:metal-responsive CopG/Arc/MetJ family transcriptional regulator
MKTAISIPDPIFNAAEDLARRLVMSRSQLYTTAVKLYIDAFDDEAVTQALNGVYLKADDSIDPVLLHLQRHSLPAEEW